MNPIKYQSKTHRKEPEEREVDLDTTLTSLKATIGHSDVLGVLREHGDEHDGDQGDPPLLRGKSAKGIRCINCSFGKWKPDYDLI